MINPELELKLQIRELSRAPRAFSASWKIPEKLSYLEGHFPGFPMVPGVAIIDATVEALRVALEDESLRLNKIKSAKFISPLLPGQEIEIQFSAESSGYWKAQWLLKSTAINDRPALVAELILRLNGQSAH